MQELISMGADVNAVGRMPGKTGGYEAPALWCAAMAVRHGNEEGLVMAKHLIKAGADVNAVGVWGGSECTPLFLALKGLQYTGKEAAKDLAKLLIDAGANVNTVGKCSGSEGAPLLMAVLAATNRGAASQDFGVELTKTLIEKGADVNHPGKSGDTILTPLMVALTSARDDDLAGVYVARLLVEWCADVTTASSDDLARSIVLEESAFRRFRYLYVR